VPLALEVTTKRVGLLESLHQFWLDR
jgi:hypothetical protein